MAGSNPIRFRATTAPHPADPSPDSSEASVDVLVGRAQRDPAAFAALYDRYFDQIYRYCSYRLDDWSAAEDAASTVFANALTALPRYRAGSFRSWLFTIAHHTVANHHRARRPDRPIDTAMDTADAAPAPDDLAVAADDRRALRGALTQLTPDQRHVVELRLAGLRGPEIAVALGRSHAAVKMLQLRAIDRLHDLLGADAATTTTIPTQETTHDPR